MRRADRRGEGEHRTRGWESQVLPEATGWTEKTLETGRTVGWVTKRGWGLGDARESERGQEDAARGGVGFG